MTEPQQFAERLEQRPVSWRANLIMVVAITVLFALLGVGVYDELLEIEDRRARAAAASSPQEVDVSHLQVGDCVYDIVDDALPEVPCSEPHKGEVVGRFRPTGPYPGELKIPEGAHEHCRELFAAYAPAYADRGLDVALVLASRRQWADENFRFTCVAYDSDFRTGRLTDPAAK